jgi:predicted amidohydrolase
MSSSVVPVAVAQFAPSDDRDRNLDVIRSLAGRAADRGAELVVFPEYSSFFVDPVSAAFVDAAEPLDGPFVGALTRLAGELGIHVVAGMAEQAPSRNRFFNTVVAVAPEDGVVATYRKQHLYDAFGARESDWVEPGPIEPVALFEVDGLRIGLQTCYDVRFPEVTRRIVDAGGELVLVPAEWVRGPLKEQHWRTLVAARAIENTVFVAAADHTPPVGVGTSLILDPMGVALADAGMKEGVALAWLDRAHLADARSINPALRLRRYRVVPRE